ncbi:MAG: hypothetical protein AAFQ90_10625 [Pseudomonadota bacterium]
MIERRTLMRSALLIPALAGTPTLNACDYAPYTAEEKVRDVDAVRSLFKHWFDREESAFEASFYALDTAPHPDFVKEHEANIEAGKALFSGFFSESKFVRSLNLLVNTGVEVIIGCSEVDVSAEADHGTCDDTPYFHLFRAETFDGSLVSLSHISTSRNPYLGQMGVWTNG